MTLTDEQLAEIESILKWTNAEKWELITLGDDVKKLGQFVVKPYVGAVAACPKESPIHSGHQTYMKFIAESGRTIRALLDEVTALRHDVTRHMEIANEHLAEVERLRSHITAARSFRVLNENGQADRHLSEAMIDD